MLVLLAALTVLAVPRARAQDPFQFPDATGTRVLTATERVDNSQPFDGNGERLEISNQTKPLMQVYGGTVKNVIVGPASGRGIQCYQSCMIEDVYFENVGMLNAISLVSTAPPETVVVISGGGMRNASNVGISINAGSTVIIENYVFDGFATAIHASEERKKVDIGTVITVMDSFARFTPESKRFVLGKPTEGVPSSVRLQNLTVYDLGDSTVCQGPEGMCVEADVSTGTPFVAAEVTIDPPVDAGGTQVGGGASATANSGQTPPPATPPPAPPPPPATTVEESLGGDAQVTLGSSGEAGGAQVGGGATATAT